MSTYIRVPGQGRIYKRGKVWYIDFWVDGCRKREKASGLKDEALRSLAAKRTDVERGSLGFERKQALHFSGFAKEYEQIRAGTRSIRSVRGYIKHLASHFGEIPLSKITPEMVEAYKQKRMKQRIACKAGADGKPRTRERKGSSVNRELAVLKNMFNVALKQHRLRGENPVKAVSFYAEQSRDYILNRDQVAALLEAADDTLRKIVLIALNTGLRRGEILGLRWSQVNFEDGVISFARTKSVKFLRVPMNSVVLSVLASIERKGDYVFAGRWGRGHLVDCKKAFEAARAKAGLPELHFHDLRHCAGTYMATAGIPLTTVQQILGHRDIRTTTRYINPNDENRRKAVNALAALFEDPGRAASPATGTNVAQGKNEERSSVELSHN
ncbi:MAG: site-specific integrase [Acidobacteriota bacterium]